MFFESLTWWQKAIAGLIIIALAALGYYIDFQYRKWIVKSEIQEAVESK